MTPSEIRARHFERLNSYRQSVEYAAYAQEIGTTIPEGELPSLIGNRWEIDEETYWEFFEALPPLGFRNGSFYLSEFSFGDITTKYTKEGDRYWCEFARYPARAQTQKPVETPWGPSQSAREIAPGIIRYDTASHGGYWLSPERVAAMPKPLREFQPWADGAGPGKWYEEDCDWAVVALAFPQFFPADAISVALKTLERYKPELYQEISAMRRGGHAV